MEAAFEIPATGALIAFCGLDGCGKTTQIRLLAERLSPAHRVFLTRQPTEHFRSDPEMRAYIDGRAVGVDAVEILPEIALLAAADRYRHVRTEVMPRLRDGQIVLSDRWVYTSYAYAGPRGLIDLDWVRRLNRYLPAPDLTICLDIPAALALERIERRGETPRWEELDLTRMEAVRTAFAEQPWGETDGYHVLDARQSVAALSARIAVLADEVLRRKGL